MGEEKVDVEVPEEPTDEKKPFVFKEYYEEHKGEILEKRKKRYQDDSEYAEKQRERARDYHRRKAAEKREQNGGGVVGGPMIRKPRRPRMVEFGGTKQKMYSVGTLAQAIGKTVQTISAWERKGYLPKSPFYFGAGVRLYSPQMIEVVRAALAKVDAVRFDDKSVHDEVTAGWRDLGVEEDTNFSVVAEEAA